MPFNGFISYSHAADGRLAPAIQHGLHHLARPWLRRRALWIFRDQTGLSVTPALWSSIRRALDDSDHFVLLASPEAAQSTWVNREIEHWLAVKSPDRILPVVTGGDWQWDPAIGDFSADSTAVPDALRGVFTEEPLYLDLRWARDDRHLSLRHSRFRDAIAQLAAPMHGVSKDELEGEDVRLHRRARRLQFVAVMALAALAVLASVAGILAMHNADRANASAADARHQQQVAAEQQHNAERFADKAHHNEQTALKQETRAKAATQEATKQEKRAREQQALAHQAAIEADRQEKLARDQKALAQQAATDVKTQRANAVAQQRIAAAAKKSAQKQKLIAKKQQALAEQWAAEARAQERAAAEQRARAQAATAKAHEQQAKADAQERIAIGRRLINKAKSIQKRDIQTALMLETAAVKLQADDESRTQLTSLVTSTHYAGAVSAPRDSSFGAVVYLTENRLLTAETRVKDSRLRVWTIEKRGNLVQIADLGTRRWNTLWAISPERQILALFDEGADSIDLLDISNPTDCKLAGKVPVTAPVHSLSISHDGRQLFVATGDPTDVGELWDLSIVNRPTPISLHREGGPGSISRASFSPDGKVMITTGNGRSAPVEVWELSGNNGPKPLGNVFEQLNIQSIDVAEFLPNRPVVVTANSAGIRLIDLSNPAAPRSLYERPVEIAWNDSIISVSIDATGKRVVTANHSGLITVFDVTGYDGNQLKLVDSWTSPKGITAAALSPSGRTLSTADRTSTATQWNIALPGSPQLRTTLTENEQQGQAAAFGPGDRSMLTIGANPAVGVWGLPESGKPRLTASPALQEKAIYLSAITTDGRVAATADIDGHVRVTDLSDPTEPKTITTFTETEAWLLELARNGKNDQLVISPDGTKLALGNIYGTPVLWDVTPGRRAIRLGPLPGMYMPAAFSPDSGTVVVRDSLLTRTWRWSVGGSTGPQRLGELASFESTYIDAIAYSPDGETLAIGGDGEAALWDVSDPSRARRASDLDSPGALTSIVFGPDKHTLATLTLERATLWDYNTVTDPLRIADLPVQPPTLTSTWRATAAFSSDGRTLVTSSAHFEGRWGTAALWDLTELVDLQSNPTAYACAMAGRGLDPDEWNRYIPGLPYRSTCPG